MRMGFEFSDYIVYVDESGDVSPGVSNEMFPIFVLTFCVIRKDVYAEKIIPEIVKLKFRHFGHDVIILHEHEIRKQTGMFSRLNFPEIFLSELTDIIRDTDVTLISAVINKRFLTGELPIEAKIELSRNEGVYILAMKFCLEMLYKFMVSKGQEKKFTYLVFESRGAVPDNELKAALHRIRDRDNQHDEIYRFKAQFVSKLINSVGLQLADLTARPIGLSVLRPDQKNRTYEILKEKMWAGENGDIVGNGLIVFPDCLFDKEKEEEDEIPEKRKARDT